MRVKVAIPQEDGSVEFTAELNDTEVGFLLDYAINSLMAKGAIPFSIKEQAQFIMPPVTCQAQ